MTQPLTVGEQLRFEACREIVRTNLKTCFDVGAALMEIRDSKLYREHWKSFDEFCKAEFNIQRAHAYRLIDASVVKASVEMSPVGDTVSSERHARQLKNVPVELRAEVLEAAAAACGGEPTADAIREAAKVIVPADKPPEPPEPIIELDATGFAIPAKLVEFWNRGKEVQKLLTALSLLRSTLRRAQEEDDLLYRPITAQSKQQTWTNILSSLDKAYASIATAVPYAVCPTCQGHLRAQCTFCQERGFISEFDYKFKTTAEDRRIRETQCKKKP